MVRLRNGSKRDSDSREISNIFDVMGSQIKQTNKQSTIYTREYNSSIISQNKQKEAVISKDG